MNSITSLPSTILQQELCKYLNHNDKVRLMATNKYLYSEMIDLVRDSKFKTMFDACMREIEFYTPRHYDERYISFIDNHFDSLLQFENDRTIYFPYPRFLHSPGFLQSMKDILNRKRIYYKTKTNEQGFKYRMSYGVICHEKISWGIKLRNRWIKIKSIVGNYSVRLNSKTKNMELWKCTGYKLTTPKQDSLERNLLRFEWKRCSYQSLPVLEVITKSSKRYRCNGSIKNMNSEYKEYSNEPEILKRAYDLIENHHLSDIAYTIQPGEPSENKKDRKLEKWNKFLLYDIKNFVFVVLESGNFFKSNTMDKIKN